ncbi:hypothetical protein ACLB1N_25040 [Escherichia coli]
MALILGVSAVSASCTGLCRQAPTSRCGELGIVLFLSVVGLKSGGHFVRTLVNGEGLSWIGYGPADHRRSAYYCWHSGVHVSPK